MKKLLALTLTLCMVLSLAAVFGVTASAATDKTEGKTYTMTAVYDDGKYTVALNSGDSVTVSNANELRLLASYVNAGKPTIGIYFQLTGDIVLGDQYDPSSPLPLLTPIGNKPETPFRGIFNGAGHTISNLFVEEKNNAAGLFGYVRGATIHGFTLVNAAISGKENVGGVIGCVLGYVRMYNISVNGKVTGETAVGGLVGSAIGSPQQVVNCASFATVSASNAAGGLFGSCSNTAFYNCLMGGRISATGTAGTFVGDSADTVVATGCYFYRNTATTTDMNTGVTGEVTEWLESQNAAETARTLNAYTLTDSPDSTKCFAWTDVNEKPALSATRPVVKVTAKNEDSVFANLSDAVRFARQSTDAVLTLLANIRTGALDIGGNYTLNLDKYVLTVSEPLTVSFGTLKITGKGKILAPATIAIVAQGGNLNIDSGSIISINSVAIRNNGTGKIYLSGTPVIKGSGNADIYLGYANTLYGNNGAEKAVAYQGATIRVGCGFHYQNGSIIVSNANEGKFTVLEYDSTHFTTKYQDNALVFEKISYWVWAVIGILFGGAALLLVITIVKTVRFKKRMKTYSFLPFLPLVFFTTRQTGFLIAAGAVIVICLLTLLITGSKQKKQEAAAKAKKNAPAKEEPKEKPVEEPKEEPVKETPVEEVKEEPAEEPVAEETKEEEPAEEPVAEETKEEEPAEEPVAEETKEEEPVEEPVAEEAKEEEPAEEPVAEETKEEEPVEEPVAEEAKEEEPAEEPVAEETKEEEPAEEPTEEEPAEETEESEEADEEAPQIPVVDGNPTVPVAKGDQVVVAERDAAGNMVYSVYKKSFMARLIQSDKEIQERYETVKNALLSYKKVNSRVSWSYDSFKSGHNQLAKITIRGKTPYLYLALDPASLEGSKYNVTDAGKAKKYSTVPCRLRLTSKRSVKWATELIDVLAEKNGLVKNPKFQPETYVSENESTEALIEKGLIKKAQ